MRPRRASRLVAVVLRYPRRGLLARAAHRPEEPARSAARPLHPVQGPRRDGALCGAGHARLLPDRGARHLRPGRRRARRASRPPTCCRASRPPPARSATACRIGLRHGAGRPHPAARPSACSPCCPTASATRARSGRRRCSRPRRSSTTSASSSTTTSGRRPARSNEILALAPLRDKWAAFGWDAHRDRRSRHRRACARLMQRRAGRHRQAGRASSPTPSRARACRSWRTTTTGTTASRPPRKSSRRTRSSGCA